MPTIKLTGAAAARFDKDFAADKKDFTCFIAEKLDLEKPPGWDEKDGPWPPFTWSGEISLCSEINTIPGRALIAKCASGRGYSITLRKTGTGKSGKFAWEADRDNINFLASIEDVCRTLFSTVFFEKGASESGGLIVVAGSTNSAKSEISRGLISMYLKENKDVRRSHVLTFEDPIEKYYVTHDGINLDTAWESLYTKGIDYTPRELGRDCAGIETGLEDALRQTPKAVFIGETRRKKDWRPILDFAATGHLIVTTTHACSLAETMEKIMDGAEAQTPTDYGAVANRVLAVIHSRTLETSGNKKVIIPTIWRRTSVSIAQLISCGISAILPEAADDNAGSLGRYWFAKKMSDPKKTDWNEILEMAYRLDIEGR